MKKITLMLLLVLIGMSYGSAQQSDIPSAKSGVQYGKKIDQHQAISVSKLEKSFGKDSTYNGKVEGVVVEVCKKKGCFMTLKREGSNEPIMVRFTDYTYFMPQDIVGKTVVVEGKAKLNTTSVAWLKHYAEDMGKSKEEIAKITKPKESITIVADGVIVK